MATYIDPPIETDPDVLADDAVDYLTTNIPGFVLRDGHLEAWQIQTVARMVAEAMDTASAVPITIFRYFGGSLLGVQPIDAVAATTTTTWTMKDAAGYTIPDGTQVAFRTAGDTLVPFVTVGDVVVPAGAGATAAGAVTVQAVDPGTAANGLAGTMELLDPLSFVTAITTAAATAGGIDAEDDSTYLSRLIDELKLLTPRPIFAPDFAILARNVTGVHRATAIDNYDPVGNTYGNERMVAVAAVDVNGDVVSAGIKTNIQNYLDAMREVNFIVNVFDPSYTVINVTFHYTVDAGADPAAVQTAAVQAVTDFLNPATWGVDAGDTAKVSWTNETHVRYNDVIAVLYGVSGLKSVPLLQLNGAAADVDMAGAVALPRAGTIDGTLA